jgi:myo-inositol-1(or 4)-monophosphatase
LDKQHVALEELNAFAVETVQQAGRKALRYYGQGGAGVKFDRTLVTEAELDLANFFQQALQERFPEHHFFDGSAVEGYTHEARRYVWIFDPLDGMSNFMAGIPIWGMSVALLENFWPVLGIFHMPATGDLFHAVAGRQAFRGQQAVRVSSQSQINDESVLLTFSRFHHHYRTTFPGKHLNLGCTSAHCCYVAMGRAEAALVANETYKDLAAARVIVEAAGGRIFKLDGTPFPIGEYLEERADNPHLLVMSPGLIDQVGPCLQPIA